MSGGGCAASETEWSCSLDDAAIYVSKKSPSYRHEYSLLLASSITAGQAGLPALSAFASVREGAREFIITVASLTYAIGATNDDVTRERGTRAEITILSTDDRAGGVTWTCQ